MKSLTGEDAKKRAGYRAADLVEEGMVLGLGTGSTIFFTLERLASRIEEGLSIRGIPTSFQTELRARTLHIPLAEPEETEYIDMAIDGADQVDRNGYLIKGRGGAHTREKIIADAANCLVIVVTADKLCDCFSSPIPVEVIPFALPHTMRAIKRQGGIVRIRECERGKDGPVVTDNGNLILDAEFGSIVDPQRLERELEMIPGVVGTGLFTGFVSKTRVIVGDKNGIREISY